MKIIILICTVKYLLSLNIYIIFSNTIQNISMFSLTLFTITIIYFFYYYQYCIFIFIYYVYIYVTDYIFNTYVRILFQKQIFNLKKNNFF